MESAELPINTLHVEASKSSTEAGYPATAKSVNPDDQSALDNIRKMVREMHHDVSDAAKSTVDTGEEAKIRLAEEAPTSIARKRWFQRKAA